MKISEEFCGQGNGYSISKTLRFELKPKGKTLENIEKEKLLESNFKKSQDYKDVKVILDNYHKYFIDDNFIRCIENGFMHNGYSKNEYIFCKNLIQKAKDSNHTIINTTDIVLRNYEFMIVPVVKYYDEEIVSSFFDNDIMSRCKFIKDKIYEIIPESFKVVISSDRLEEIVSFFIDKNIFSKNASDSFEEISNVTIKI